MPSEIEQDFAEFWSLSTRKRSMGDAMKAYISARKIATKDEIHEGYRRYGLETADRERRFVLYPATWLRAWGWRDEADQQILAEPRRTAAEERYSRAMHQLARDALEPPDTQH